MEFGMGAAEAGAVAVGPNVGYFHFAEPQYVELYVRLVNGCGLNAHFWVLMGSLTSTQFQLTVTDTQTASVRAYFNPQGFRSNVLDTAAFATCPAPNLLTAQAPGAAQHAPHGSSRASAVPALGPRRESVATDSVRGACIPTSTTHCLGDGRFETRVTWLLPDGSSGAGLAVPLTTHSGGFDFFSPGSLDLVAKVVEGPTHFEVHYSGISNVAYLLRVTDSTNDCVRTYASPQGVSSTVGDPEAFPNPAVPCGIFADGFEAGDFSLWSLVVP